jgi:DNA-binding response OmpR family regulator
MPETPKETDEQRADVVVRLEHEDATHTPIVGTGGSDVGWMWYGKGMSASRVLVVDDEADVRRLVRELLERAGYTVDEASNGRAALRAVYASKPELVVLDVTMPELDGWQTLERIRDVTDVPVLMLTARTAELEKVRGLRAGADDYVTKPFGKQELLARVEALLRRPRRAQEPAPKYADATVEIDFAQAQVRVAGREVALTPLELRLLTTFVRHPNQVLSRDQLLELVWGGAANAAPDQVKLYVGYLRRKLGDESLIETVRGFGYRYRRRG